MLIYVKAIKFFFWSFRNNLLPPLHRTLLRASTVPKITPGQSKVNLQSSATQNHPGANPPSPRHHPLESNIPDFTRKSPVTTVKIYAYNHATSHLPCWRGVTPMRSRQIAIDNDEIFWMKSQPSRQQIAIVKINSHMKIVMLHISHQRPIRLREKSSVQIDLLIQRERDFWAFHPILIQRNINTYM